jgi:heparanase 1
MTTRIKTTQSIRAAISAGLAIAAMAMYSQQPAPLAVAPKTMPKLGTVDPRFVSYNVEMVEVTGGRFWKPYKSGAQGAKPPAPPATQQNLNQQVGDNAAMFQYRPPIDLSNARLRKLASALGPSYIRVSGSWANSTYFQDDDNAAMKDPPKGFRGVLTRAEWKGVIDFGQAVDAKIVTSVAVSSGVRDANGAWVPDQAKALFDYTKTLGGSVYATEFMNEPTFPGPGGAPAGYDAAAFARDIKAFEPFLRKESPQAVFLGPGSVGEGVSLMPGGAPAGMQMKLLETPDLMKATEPVFDAFSYHFYGGVSHRCMGSVTLAQAMTADWFDRTDKVEAFYAAIRNQYLAGKPMWLTETAEAACGGDLLARQFVDSFRYLNQLGTLAQKGVQVVMHNTLASSDYGLLDEETYDPRPNYWAALLFKRTMGPVVLDPGTPIDQAVRVYAQCTAGTRGGVTILALNTDATNEQTLEVPFAGQRFTLTAAELTGTEVMLNGVELNAAADGSVPALQGEPVAAGTVKLAPASITFLTLPTARNKNCK